MTIFLIIFVLAFILHLAAKIGFNPQKKFRDHARVATGFAFVFTGISHFAIPDKFMEMMPSFLPAPLFLIYLSGVFEILGGIGLALSKTKVLAAPGLVLLLFAVFPANIYVALNNVQLGGWMNYAVYQWLRLPLQFVLIGWVCWSADIFKSRRKIYES